MCVNRMRDCYPVMYLKYFLPIFVLFFYKNNILILLEKHYIKRKINIYYKIVIVLIIFLKIKFNKPEIIVLI